MEPSFGSIKYVNTFYTFLTRPHRLTVRTPGSHPGNWSSILHEVTNFVSKKEFRTELFLNV